MITSSTSTQCPPRQHSHFRNRVIGVTDAQNSIAYILKRGEEAIQMSTPAVTTFTPIRPAVQLKRIAFATDFSESSMKALPVASALARKFASTLFVCHVVTPTPLAI